MDNEEKKEKHAGGRPLKFKSVEELQKKIDEYFATTGTKTKKVFSKRLGDVIDIEYYEPATICNLALFLDVDRDTLLNYGKREEYFGTIKKAKARVESNIEYGGLMGYLPPATNIFNLKNNFGWVDKQEVDHQSKGEKIGVIVYLPELKEDN